MIYGIVKQQEGWINVFSDEGKGSEFKVYFPAYKGQQLSEKNKDKASRKLVSLHGKRILLVEDDGVFLNMICDLLKEEKYVVFPAANAKEALKIFKEEKGRLDLLFTDSVMPGMNGLELAEKLKAINPEIKVIISSGYLDSRADIDGAKNEGYYFLSKPYEIKELSAKVSMVLDQKKNAAKEPKKKRKGKAGK